MTLQESAWNGKIEEVRVYLMTGEDPNNPPPAMTDTPLICAVYNGHMEIVKLLLDYNADTNFINYMGRTALYYAIDQNKPEIMQLLLDHGADINLNINLTLNNNTEETLKEFALRSCYEEIKRIMQEHLLNPKKIKRKERKMKPVRMNGRIVTKIFNRMMEE